MQSITPRCVTAITQRGKSYYSDVAYHRFNMFRLFIKNFSGNFADFFYSSKSQVLKSMLLHILEEEHPDVRILSTAGPGLLKMVSDSSFRDNLFFILRQTSISVSPLRESTDDIADITDYLLTKYAQKKQLPKQRLDACHVLLHRFTKAFTFGL